MRIPARLILITLSALFFTGCSTSKTVKLPGSKSEKGAQNISIAQSEDVQLSTPIAHYPSALFEDSVLLEFALPWPGSTIRYSNDGSLPCEKSPVSSKPQYIRSSTIFKARTFHPEFQSSDLIEINFVKAKKASDVKNIDLVTKPNEKYKGQGALSLIDLKKGTLDFKEPVWMGFSEKTVEIKIIFDKPRKVSKILLSTMTDHGSWIFLPKQVKVINQQNQFLVNWPTPDSQEPQRLYYLAVTLDNTEAKQLHIIIENMSEIPGWHPGAGNPPWLFIDEIVIY